MLPVRVFFKKKGLAAYISHLDLQRAVFRALNRSGLRAVYTEGFNPHIKIAFASPLSVFIESDYEIFDMFLKGDLPYDEITRRLATEFPQGIEIVKTAPPVKKLNELAFADYTIALVTEKTAKEIENALSGEIKVLKKSKKGDFITDIADKIRFKRIEDGGAPNAVSIKLRCVCGARDHLNVMYLLDFLKKDIQDFAVTRTLLLDTLENAFA